ncbi:DEAD/DEAH box helicase [Psychrobacillus sp. FSL H8-0510]|uniref:DEAD/DEAH box helicase n=1 Tax=Psychrobacillus sp. FSL H8-0510 TaxID=2921394 RepID=UPI0030FAB4D4
MNYFFDTNVFIEGNENLRKPQIQAYLKIQSFFNQPDAMREALVVLPTGTGKSGLIAIAPYGVSKKRVLIITPNHVTNNSIAKTVEALEDNFWINMNVIFSIEDNPIIIRYEKDVLQSELNSAHFVYTNVQKLTGANSLMNRVQPDHFDFIIIDEAHHAPASTWQKAISYFNDAKILHVTGTPYRGDSVIVPGNRIHETKLSEVMEQGYVKWLRNRTISNEKISFTLEDGTVLTLDEAKEIKEDSWVQRNVAMSDDCSLEVIRKSIEELKKFKSISPSVPHKIMASACSIRHAEIIKSLYEAEGMTAVLIHSKMDPALQDKLFRDIENHKCDVVINVDKMGEGYDHKYLTIAALFRPYKSLNKFAQVIGRVLRAIPEQEITKHEIDNNALVIYHEELGLDVLWDYFKNELEDIGKYKKVKEIDFSDDDPEKRETLYAAVSINGETNEVDGSYSFNLDFNKKFGEAEEQIRRDRAKTREELENIGLDDETIDETLNNLARKKRREITSELKAIYNEKRPLERRKEIKRILNGNVRLISIELLDEYNIDPKGLNLYSIFKRYLPKYTKDTTKNDGVLVIYINTKLKIKFAGRELMEISDLVSAQNHLPEIEEEVGRILNGIS